MSLKGNLQSVDLANVLQMLAVNEKEGTLLLFDGDTRKSIYFSKDGVSMLSRGRRGQDTLGRILMRSGKISPEMLQEALAKQSAEGKRLGEALQELGAATPAEVDDAVRIQIEEEIYNLFIWKEAAFEFVEGPPPEQGDGAPTRVTFNVDAIVKEAQRRADEWNQICGLVPSLDEIYRPTEKIAEANLSDPVFQAPYAARIKDALQAGNLNVSELIDTCHAPKFETCKILSILLDQGAVDPLFIADLQNLANEAATKGDHKQAAKFLSRVVDLGGATPQVNMSLGYSLEALDEPGRASIYFHAAAEAFREVGEHKQAFDSYQRIVRVLPTDLSAVTNMVDVSCDHPEILAEHTHEVVEAGRTLAQCMKELGRLPAAVQILHKVAKASPQDVPLRMMLVQAYVDGAMNNEAMVELEAMAEMLLSQGNIDEALRCLRRIVAIDRHRPGVLKRIETLTRARDSGKRKILRYVALGGAVAAVGAIAWGVWFYQEGVRRKQLEVDAIVSGALNPLRKKFEDAEKDFDASITSLEAWKTSNLEKVQADTKAVEASLKAMDNAVREIATKTQQVLDEHGPGAFETSNPVDEQTAVRRKRLDGIGGYTERKGRVFEAIADDAKEAFRRERALAETQPIGRIPDVERILGLLKAVDPSDRPKVVQVGNKLEDVSLFLDTLRGYKAKVEETQAGADTLWKEGKLRDSHQSLASYLGKFFTVTGFAETFRFRVRVSTVPAGASLAVIDGFRKGETLTAPQDLEYTVLGGLKLEVSAPGFLTVNRVVEPFQGTLSEAAINERCPFEMKVVLPKVPVWSTQLGTGGIEAPPVPTADGASLVVADRDGTLHVLDLKNGGRAQSLDARSPSGFQSSPVVTADSVYAASADGVVLALDLPALKERWRKEGADGIGPVYGSPVLAGDLLVVAGPSGDVAAWDAKTGEPRWQQKLEAGTRRPLLAARGWIVATCEDGRIRTVSLDGKEVVTVLPSAREESAYTAPGANPVAVGEKVLVGLEGAGQEFALIELPVPGAASPHNGYRWGAREEGAEVSGAAAGGDELVLLYTDGTVRRVPHRQGPRPSDRALRALPEKERPVGAPALLGELAFLAGEKSLTAVRALPGGYEEVWKWTFAGDAVITTTPVLAGRLVVVCSRDGRVHALLRD